MVGGIDSLERFLGCFNVYKFGLSCPKIFKKVFSLVNIVENLRNNDNDIYVILILKGWETSLVRL